MASCAGWPASLDPILSKVLEGRCGYLAVRQLILAELTVSELRWRVAMHNLACARAARRGCERVHAAGCVCAVAQQCQRRAQSGRQPGAG